MAHEEMVVVIRRAFVMRRRAGNFDRPNTAFGNKLPNRAVNGRDTHRGEFLSGGVKNVIGRQRPIRPLENRVEDLLLSGGIAHTQTPLGWRVFSPVAPAIQFHPYSALLITDNQLSNAKNLFRCTGL